MSEPPLGVETDIRVGRRRNREREIGIYDRYGAVGSIHLTLGEAKRVRDRLDEVLDDD